MVDRLLVLLKVLPDDMVRVLKHYVIDYVEIVMNTLECTEQMAKSFLELKHVDVMESMKWMRGEPSNVVVKSRPALYPRESYGERCDAFCRQHPRDHKMYRFQSRYQSFIALLI